MLQKCVFRLALQCNNTVVIVAQVSHDCTKNCCVAHTKLGECAQEVFAWDTRQITRQQLAQTKVKEPFRGKFQTPNKKTKHSHEWVTIAQGRCGGERVACQHRRKSSNFTPPQTPHHIALGKQGKEATGKCPSQQWCASAENRILPWDHTIPWIASCVQRRFLFSVNMCAQFCPL